MVGPDGRSLLVLTYTAGTVALELAPERVLMALSAKDLPDSMTPGDAGTGATSAATQSYDTDSKSVLRHLRRPNRK